MQFLIYFRQIFHDFRLQELESILHLLDIQGASFDRSEYSSGSPFLIIDLPSVDDARRICQRSVLIRAMYALVAKGTSHQNVLSQVMENLDLVEMYAPDRQRVSWRFTIERFLRRRASWPSPELIKMFAQPLQLMGPVDLHHAKNTFSVIEGFTPTPESTADSSTYVLDKVFFGIWISDGDPEDACTKFDLKKRLYLGTTTFDAQLSLVLANQALARPGSLIFDPFTGTGSFLYACAHYGAYILGSDLDGRQMRGTTRHMNANGETGGGIMANFHQYQLENRLLDLLINDQSAPISVFREGQWFDAIVADPPYGVRAGAKRIVSAQEAVQIQGTLGKYKEDAKNAKLPEMIDYDMEDVVVDLINFSVRYLRVGGRLVFWLPTATREYKIEDLPTHPALKLIANSCQSFGKWERRLITMERIESPLNVSDSQVAASIGAANPGHAQFRMKYFTAFEKTDKGR